MEREIKFRAYNPKEKKMSADFTLYEIASAGSKTIFPFGFVANKDTILMQYTGLKDKNGKEIYEGDILTDHSKRPTRIGEVNGEIIFFKDYGGYAIAIYSDEYTERYIHRLDSAVAKEYEVIGNIYENPNLIEDNK